MDYYHHFFLRNYNINKLESFVQFIRKLMFSLLVSKADAHFQSHIMQVLTVCSMYVKESAALEFGFNAQVNGKSTFLPFAS